MRFEDVKTTILEEIESTETPEALCTKIGFWNKELKLETTELEFLQWLYTVIGDESINYMWELSQRVERLKKNKLSEEKD